MLGNDESEMIDIHDASIGAARHFEGIELREGIMSLVHRLNPTCQEKAIALREGTIHRKDNILSTRENKSKIAAIKQRI